MNEIFNLHIDPSGFTGGPVSSRHMNRNQARQVIRENIINNHILSRAVDEDSCENFYFIARIEHMLEHKIHFNLSADWNFEDLMGLNGVSYWLREFQRCKIMLQQSGTEAEPTKTDEILLRSVLLVSSNHHANYLILQDEEFRNMPDPQVRAQNALLVDELDKKHNMLEALVEGYLWAQGLEKKLERLYSISPNDAVSYGYLEAVAKFGEPGTPLESTILEGGTVSLKEIDH